MRFTKRSSSSFGTDSDVEDEHHPNIILGDGNNQTNMRIKPALSTDKTALHHNPT